MAVYIAFQVKEQYIIVSGNCQGLITCFSSIYKLLLTLAESWPETVKLKFLAALAWS